MPHHMTYVVVVRQQHIQHLQRERPAQAELWMGMQCTHSTINFGFGKSRLQPSPQTNASRCASDLYSHCD